VIVAGGGEGGGEVVGVIDFGDLVESWTVNELAIGVAYRLVPRLAGFGMGLVAVAGLFREGCGRCRGSPTRSTLYASSVSRPTHTPIQTNQVVEVPICAPFLCSMLTSWGREEGHHLAAASAFAAGYCGDFTLSTKEVDTNNPQFYRY
jgi:hypothetical protein